MKKLVFSAVVDANKINSIIIKNTPLSLNSLNIRQLILLLFGFATFILVCFGQVNNAVAKASYSGVLEGETLETNPKPRNVQVSAIMPDVIPPSPPILQTPANHSQLNQNNITFSWYGSVDNVAIDHYQLWLNGQLYLDQIPLTTTTGQAYQLQVDPVNNLFYLSLTPPLKDGRYTWNIVAVDTSANSKGSAIWDFVLDTQAPLFVVNKVDTSSTSISAYDASSVPTDPIVLENPDPWLAGVGEPNSQVTLTLILNQSVLTTYQFTVDGQGDWQISLANSLPIDQVIMLKFLVIDPVGNVSVIENLPVIYPSKQVVLEVPALIAPYSKQNPQQTPPPTISLPYFGPKELKIKLYQSVSSILPPKARIAFTRSLQQLTLIKQQFKLTNYLALIILLIPIVTTGLDLIIKIKPLRLSSFKHIFWTLGYWRKQPTGGIVVSLPGFWPLSYATVKVFTISNNEPWLITTLITNRQGLIPKPKIKTINNQERQLLFYLDINHPNVGFPSLITKPSWLETQEWYQQQRFTIDQASSSPIPLVIPTDSHDPKRLPNQLKDHWYDLASLSGRWVLPQLLTIGLVAFVFSSIINLIVLVFYLAVLAWHKLTSQIEDFQQIKLVDTKGKPVQNVVALVLSNQKQLVFLAQSDKNGLIKLRAKAIKTQTSLRLVHPKLKSQTAYLRLDEKQPLSQILLVPGS